MRVVLRALDIFSHGERLLMVVLILCTQINVWWWEIVYSSSQLVNLTPEIHHLSHNTTDECIIYTKSHIQLSSIDAKSNGDRIMDGHANGLTTLVIKLLSRVINQIIKWNSHSNTYGKKHL